MSYILLLILGVALFYFILILISKTLNKMNIIKFIRLLSWALIGFVAYYLIRVAIYASFNLGEMFTFLHRIPIVDWLSSLDRSCSSNSSANSNSLTYTLELPTFFMGAFLSLGLINYDDFKSDQQTTRTGTEITYVSDDYGNKEIIGSKPIYSHTGSSKFAKVMLTFLLSGVIINIFPLITFIVVGSIFMSMSKKVFNNTGYLAFNKPLLIAMICLIVICSIFSIAAFFAY